MTLAELAEYINGEVKGNPSWNIDHVASVTSASENAVTFFVNHRALDDLHNTKAGAVLIAKEFINECPRNSVVVGSPYAAFAKVAELLHPRSSVSPGVHVNAVINDSAQVADTASIGPFCFIADDAIIGERTILGAHCTVGEGATIGDDCLLHERVTVCDKSVLGHRCNIMPGAVVGADGFGYAEEDDNWLKIPQLGRVIVGDDVDIGANTTIDRGSLDDTCIGHGVKLDNQIQIAHNVQIGEHTIMAGCAAVAGSAKIGKRCRFGGRASILGHLTIADDVHVTATSVVTRSISKPGIYSSTLAVQENCRWRKVAGRLHRLNELAERVRKLEKTTHNRQAGE